MKILGFLTQFELLLRGKKTIYNCNYNDLKYGPFFSFFSILEILKLSKASQMLFFYLRDKLK